MMTNLYKRSKMRAVTLYQEVSSLSEEESEPYDWPHADEGQIWRHITNFYVTAVVGEEIDTPSPDMYIPIKLSKSDADTDEDQFMIWGELFSIYPQEPTKFVKFQSSNFAMDNGGDDRRCPNRGYWVEDQQSYWYKLEDPAPAFEPLAIPWFKFTYTFLSIYDTIQYIYDNKRGKFSIMEMYNKYTSLPPREKSYRGITLFDIEWMEEHRLIVLDYLANYTIRGFTASSKLYKSIENFKAADAKMFIKTEPLVSEVCTVCSIL